MYKNFGKIIVIIILILFLVNLGSIKSLSNSESLNGGTLIDASTTDALILNPVLSSDSTSRKIENLIFQGMMTYDKDMKIVPELAYRWAISANKLDYTFYLRDDVY